MGGKQTEEKTEQIREENKKKPARPVHRSRSCSVTDKRRRRVRQRNLRVALFCLILAMVFLAAGILRLGGSRNREGRRQEEFLSRVGEDQNYGPEEWQKEGAPYIDVELLDPNEYSRPQIALSQVKHIAIHYTANPGSTAMDNRNYFNNLASTHETKVSSHFIVGLEGEVVQCIPTAEISYATNERNVDTVSIECCHPDETGAFLDATYDSAVKLTAWLCTRFSLTEEDVIRHYDVTGKACPKYYVDHPEAWEQMKRDIGARIQEDYSLQENLG